MLYESVSSQLSRGWKKKGKNTLSVLLSVHLNDSDISARSLYNNHPQEVSGQSDPA